MNRRYFIKSGSVALASFGVMASAPSFLKRALAETHERHRAPQDAYRDFSTRRGRWT